MDKTARDKLRLVADRLQDVVAYLKEDIDEINQHFIEVSVINKKLQLARESKKEHKDSSQCKGSGCTACHFYSGGIAVLNELLGINGVID